MADHLPPSQVSIDLEANDELPYSAGTVQQESKPILNEVLLSQYIPKIFFRSGFSFLIICVSLPQTYRFMQ